MSNVAELKSMKGSDPVPVKDAPALGMSIQVDLGAGRVATLQTFVDSSCSVYDLNAMLDKMTSAGDRQRAHYKIEELERDLKQELKLQAQHQEDLDNIDKRYDADQAARHAAIGTMQTTVDNYKETAREQHVTSGRRAEFELKGTARGHVNTLESSITAKKQELVTATNERDVAHAQSKITSLRRQEMIDNIQADIDRCKAIVEKGRADSAG